MKALRFVKASPWLACYEGEGGGTGDGGGGTGTPAGGTPAGGTPAGQQGNPPPDAETVKTQLELNTALKREKEKFRQEREKVIKQLEAIQRDKATTDEAKAALENQLEELRQAHLSAEERAAIALKKAEKEAADKIAGAEATAKNWQSRHDSLMVGYEITSNFGGPDIVPGSLEFVESYLRPRARLVENTDSETGKGNGTFTVKVKMAVKGKDDKPVEMDLTVAEAKKAMMDEVEKFGFLFKSTAAGGLGAANGQPGKKLRVADMSPSQYMEARKKNPASVGLRAK